MPVFVLQWIWMWAIDWWRRRLAPLGHGGSTTPTLPSSAAATSFEPAPHRRRGGRPKPPWVVEEIFRMHDERPSSPRVLATEFNRRHAAQGVSLCPNTVVNWFRRLGDRAQAARAATRNRLPHFTPANQRWALDCTGKEDASQVQHAILGVIDHGSRLLLMLCRLRRQSAWAILAKLFEAIDMYGKPEVVRTDNAAVFHGVVFRSVLAAVGIRHEFIELGCPWQNGRIERLFLTLKQKLDRVIPRSGHTLDVMLREFAFWYNEARPHQHLHGLTPGEVWRGIQPYRTPPKQVVAFSGWNGLLRGFHHLRC